jgi:hypothetical protein
MGRGRAHQIAATGARAAPHHVARVALTPRASPAGARHVFKQLLLDRRAQIREELIFYG